VRASPRHSDKDPRGVKTQEGIELRERPNTSLAATDRCSDESPEGEVSGVGSGGATYREAKLANDRRA